MATMTRGFSFSAGGTINSANLDDLINVATIAGITRTDIDRSTVTPITVASSAPAASVTGEVWLESTENALLSYSGSEWRAAHTAAVTVQADQAIAQGQVVRAGSNGVSASGYPRVVLCGSARAGEEIGVAAQAIALGDTGVIITNGLVDAVIDGTAVTGDILKISSSTSGSVVVDNTLTLGSHAVLGLAIRGDSGGKVLMWLRR